MIPGIGNINISVSIYSHIAWICELVIAASSAKRCNVSAGIFVKYLHPGIPAISNIDKIAVHRYTLRPVQMIIVRANDASYANRGDMVG
jgi:hypothetical protein